MQEIAGRIAALTLTLLLLGASLASFASSAHAACSTTHSVAPNAKPAANAIPSVPKTCNEDVLADADAIGLRPETQSPLDPDPIPEPETYALLITGLSVMALVVYRRRRRR